MRLPRAFYSARYWRLSIGVALALVFALAALGKLIRLPDFLRVVSALDLFPAPWQPFLVFVLIGLEMTIAICLVTPSLRFFGALLSSVLLAAFVVLVAYALHHGLNISCGCFAFLRDRTFSVGLLIQDLVLLALAVYLCVSLWRHDRRTAAAV